MMLMKKKNSVRRELSRTVWGKDVKLSIVNVSPYYRPWRPLRESTGIALLFFVNVGTLDGGGGQRHAPVAFTPGKDLVPIVQEAGWALEQVWIGAENLAPIGIRSPDLPARSESRSGRNFFSPPQLCCLQAGQYALNS